MTNTNTKYPFPFTARQMVMDMENEVSWGEPSIDGEPDLIEIDGEDPACTPQNATEN